MAAKKIAKSKSDNRREVVRDLAKQEGAAGKKAVKNMKGSPVPKYVVIALWLVVLGAVGVFVLFQTQRQMAVNENRQQFLAVRSMMREVESSAEFAAQGMEWQRGDQCEYTPPKGVQITFEPNTMWTCRSIMERVVADFEDVEDLKRQFIGIAATKFGGKKLTGASLMTADGLYCTAGLTSVEQVGGEEPIVRLSCSKGAYRSWYPNNEQRRAVEGKDAWRTFE